MKIKPTSEMILSNKHEGDNCPYYQAIVKACPTLKGRVHVGTLVTVIDINKLFWNPQILVNWIQKYDLTVRGTSIPPDVEVSAPEVDLLFLDQYCNEKGEQD